MESWQALFLVANLAKGHLNAIDVRTHGGLGIRRLLVATIHRMGTWILLAPISGVRDGNSERSFGVDHLSSCGGRRARCRAGRRLIASAMSHSGGPLGAKK